VQTDFLLGRITIFNKLYIVIDYYEVGIFKLAQLNLMVLTSCVYYAILGQITIGLISNQNLKSLAEK